MGWHVAGATRRRARHTTQAAPRGACIPVYALGINAMIPTIYVACTDLVVRTPWGGGRGVDRRAHPSCAIRARPPGAATAPTHRPRRQAQRPVGARSPPSRSALAPRDCLALAAAGRRARGGARSRTQSVWISLHGPTQANIKYILFSLYFTDTVRCVSAMMPHGSADCAGSTPSPRSRRATRADPKPTNRCVPRACRRAHVAEILRRPGRLRTRVPGICERVYHARWRFAPPWVSAKRTTMGAPLGVMRYWLESSKALKAHACISY